MKKELILLTFLICFICLPFVQAGVYIGLVDGYVKDITGVGISGINVTVEVVDCVGESCLGSYLTEADGYYVVGNLNLPENYPILVTAGELGTFGASSGTSDEYQVDEINVTVCKSPTNPVLQAVPDSHSTTALFNWTSGTDRYLPPLDLYDQFELDSLVTDITNPALIPVTRAGLSYGTHIWEARTCNDYCCSEWISDSFNIGNSQPTEPSDAESEVNESTIILTWTSGTDSDGDATYDEFKYDNGTIISPATSPFTLDASLLVTWSVRTCDSSICSDWLEVDSVSCDVNGTACPSCSCGGGGTCKECNCTDAASCGYYKTKIFCNGIQINDANLLELKLKFSKDTGKISIQGTNLSLKNLEYCPWCYDGVKNYDETGIDCGPSCRDCAEKELPLIMDKEGMPQYIFNIILVLALVSAISGIYLAGRLLYKLINKEF